MPKDGATETARELAESFSPAGSPVFKYLGAILQALGLGGSETAKKAAPPLNQPLPRIIQNEKGEFVDLNTGRVVAPAPPKAPASGEQKAPQSPVDTILRQLLGKAQPRPELGQKEPVATFAGRVVRPGEQAAQVMQRFPAGELESGGIAMQAPALLGAILPQALRGMTPQARAMLNVVASQRPELFKQMLESPTPFFARVAGRGELGPGIYGTAEVYRPTAAMATRVGQPELAKNPTAGIISIIEPEVGKTTVPHEVQHLLNFPRVQQTSPEDAATIGMLLRDVLAERAPELPLGSLSQRLTQQRTMGPLGLSGRMEDVARLPRGDITASGHPLSKSASLPAVAGEGYYVPGETVLEHAGRAMMDEGLAYLSETVPSQDPILKALAFSLGIAE